MSLCFLRSEAPPPRELPISERSDHTAHVPMARWPLSQKSPLFLFTSRCTPQAPRAQDPAVPLEGTRHQGWEPAGDGPVPQFPQLPSGGSEEKGGNAGDGEEGAVLGPAAGSLRDPPTPCLGFGWASPPLCPGGTGSAPGLFLTLYFRAPCASRMANGGSLPRAAPGARAGG